MNLIKWIEKRAIAIHLAVLLLLITFHFVKNAFGDGNLPPLHPYGRVWINLVFLMLLPTTWLIYFRITPGFSARSITLYLAAGALIATSFPIFSGDLNEYLIRGRIMSHYGLSPYAHYPMEFPQDLFYPLSVWTRVPQSYGPVTAYIQALVTWLCGHTVWAPTWCFKLMTLAMLAVTTFGIGRLARLMDANPGIAMSMFCFNPFVIVSFLQDGHNDIFMIGFLVFAVLALTASKNTAAMLLTLLAIMSKYTAVYAAPFLFIMALKSQFRLGGWKAVLRWLVMTSLAGLLLIAALYAPFLEKIMEHFKFLLAFSDGFYTNAVPYAVRQALGLAGLDVSPELISAIFRKGYLVLYAGLLIACFRVPQAASSAFMKILTVAFLGFCFQITSAWSQWYLTWSFPWLILARFPKNPWLYLMLTLVGLFAYFKRPNYLLLAGLTGYLLLLGVSWIREKNGGKAAPVRP